MGNESSSQIVQAPGMETNQGELGRPPTVRFNTGAEDSWFFSENRKPGSAVRFSFFTTTSQQIDCEERAQNDLGLFCVQRGVQ